VASVNLRHLHTFGEVARLGSVSAAARAVHISQPAVTQAVAGVERYFGASLLIRRNAGVALTAAGELCARRIERSISHLRDAVAELTRGSSRNFDFDATRLMRSAHLYALSAVVEHRNFSLAARAQHVSQPSVPRAALRDACPGSASPRPRRSARASSGTPSPLPRCPSSRSGTSHTSSVRAAT